MRWRRRAGRRASYVDSRTTTVFGSAGEHAPGRLDAVDAWHLDVHEHERRREGRHERDTFLAGLGFTDDLETRRRLQHGLGGTTERRLVVDDQHRHRGGHAVIVT